MEMAFDDLRQDRRRVIEHEPGRIVVVIAAARRTVETRPVLMISGTTCCRAWVIFLALKSSRACSPYCKERRRAGFADSPAQEDRMEVFRRTAGQFRFILYSHRRCRPKKELERRVGNDGHIDEGMDRRLVEIVVAGKGFIGFVHDSQGRRWSTVGSQRRESEQGLASPVSDDFTGIDGTAAADVRRDQVSIYSPGERSTSHRRRTVRRGLPGPSASVASSKGLFALDGAVLPPMMTTFCQK